jgi:hypothetical protein
MQIVQELQARNKKERKEILRLRRVCKDLSRLCVHGKSQREKCEQDYQRRIKEGAAGNAKEEMDTQSVLQEKERLEAQRETKFKG